MSLLLRAALLVVTPAFALALAYAWPIANIQPWLCLACAILPLSAILLGRWRKP